ncbi:hypothetical protein NPIL_577731 [Nephila pilipes]|uniref:Uncharacterized protein n=1 Tax=Nephila pilipes TaxID=299642 RepID=A0A8X6URR9_NEPPI|nr:hypothetical protein NPIL_577731 [Nephila pilipes]
MEPQEERGIYPKREDEEQESDLQRREKRTQIRGCAKGEGSGGRTTLVKKNEILALTPCKAERKKKGVEGKEKSLYLQLRGKC